MKPLEPVLVQKNDVMHLELLGLLGVRWSLTPLGDFVAERIATERS